MTEATPPQAGGARPIRSQHGTSTRARPTSRRGFLAGLGTAAALGVVGGLTLKPTAAFAGRPRELSFHNLHTGENLHEVYWADGGYRPESLQRIDHILRDWRTGDVKAMDPDLLDLLFRLHASMDSSEPFQVISGYRSPKTNAKLAADSNGVAKKSFHMRGMAIDIALPDRDLVALRDTAWGMQSGGVGYYAKSGFVHVDTGRVRHWNF
jgi:uncharacterized protein YcbK (DUF882 family)